MYYDRNSDGVDEMKNSLREPGIKIRRKRQKLKKKNNEPFSRKYQNMVSLIRQTIYVDGMESG